MIREHLEKKNPPEKPKQCVCKSDCPLNGDCHKEGVVYQASVEVQGEPTKTYIGSCATSFKARYANHKSSIKNESSLQKTALSTFYHEKIKEGKIPYTPVGPRDFPKCIKFKILKLAKPFNVETGKCYLCLEEKLAIWKADPRTSLNRRSEFMTSCPHKKNFTLAKYKDR